MPFNELGLWVPRALEQKGLPRPHIITILIGLAPLAAAAVALLISFSSFKVAEKALNVSQQSLELGQRAYVAVVSMSSNKPPLPTAPVNITIRLRNSGNTPGYFPLGSLRVIAIDRDKMPKNLTKIDVSVVEPYSRLLPILSPPIEIGQKEEALMHVSCSPEFLEGFSSSVEMAAIMPYDDVFHQKHEMRWGWIMSDYEITSDMNDLVVVLILLSKSIIVQLRH